MPLIPFPDVPAYPGVPPLPGATPPPPGTLLTGDAPGVAQVTEAPIWGIFLAGEPVVVADSVVSFDYDKEYRIAGFPIERGSFANYNKVELPYSERITFAKGGTDSDRAAFLDNLAAVLASLDLFDVWTPDATYLNANVVRVSFSRTNRNGVTLILADVMIQEVRTATETTFTNTVSPSGVREQSGGSVQAKPPTAAQSDARTKADAAPAAANPVVSI